MSSFTFTHRPLMGSVFIFLLTLQACSDAARETGTATPYTIGGTVSGLTGTVVLQNNGGNNLSLTDNGMFTFTNTIISGGTYNVTVLTHSTGQDCTVANGSGTVRANVTDVAVTCISPPAAPILSMGFGPKTLQFTWTPTGNTDFYKLSENSDSVSGYTQISGNLTVTNYNHTIPVHRRLNARYLVEACNALGCTASNIQILSTNLTQAIGYAKASNTEANDQFGYSVALSGDGNTLAVGAFLEDSTGIDGDQTNNMAMNAGAVYVFTRIGTTWTQQAYVKASNIEAGDQFGYAVALSGDGNTLAVGAPNEDSAIGGDQASNASLEAGAVYVFTRTGASWTQQAYVKASNTEAGDQFGIELALSDDGNTLAVAAYFEDSDAIGINGNQASNAKVNAGAVYVFTRASTSWTQQAYVKASNTEANDLFGDTLALSSDGNTLAVGASYAAILTGSVYVFTRAGSAWIQQAYVKGSNTESGDFFGSALALSSDGNTLAVGALGEASAATGIGGNQANNTANGAGAVYVFTRASTSWTQQAYIKASNTEAGDGFGYALALSSDGNTLAVGVANEDSAATGIGGDQTNNAELTAGAVFLFTRAGGTTWTQQAYIKASNTGAEDRFGFALALSNDGNTLAVGAYQEDSAAIGIGDNQSSNAAAHSGAVYLY